MILVLNYLGHHLVHPNFIGWAPTELMSVVTAAVFHCYHYHSYCPWAFPLNGATSPCSLPMTGSATKLTEKHECL